jgi:hypothetical protein
MNKLTEIFKKKDDDEGAEAQPDATQAAGTQPEGDASHPPAAMPEDASAAAAPADAPETFSSIEEYEQTLPEPDISATPPTTADMSKDA